MRTLSGPAEEALGIIRYDTHGESWLRFATDLEPIHLNLGHDGLLHALRPGGNPTRRTLAV